MKFAIIDQIKNGDCFEELFDTKEKAIQKATIDWNRMSDHDKSRREYFAVFAGDVDEEGCFDINTAAIVKDYK